MKFLTSTCDICWFSICATFVGIVFVFITFVDTISIAYIISSHTILDSWAILFQILNILTNTCARIPTYSFLYVRYFLHSHWHVLLFHFLIWITCCTIEFALKIAWNMFFHCFSFISACYHIKYFNIYIFCFTGNTCYVDKLSKKLQFPLHLSRIFMNG